jgi:flagellar biosynthetic protein FliQ
MTIGETVYLLRDGVFQVLTLAAPMLITALVVGLVVAILQATTSIQEQTLTFVPKLIAILLVLAFLGGWMFTRLGEYTIRLFSMIPEMAR